MNDDNIEENEEFDLDEDEEVDQISQTTQGYNGWNMCDTQYHNIKVTLTSSDMDITDELKKGVKYLLSQLETKKAGMYFSSQIPPRHESINFAAYANEAFQDGPPIRSGFGHLIPRAMKVRTLGTIWSSSLFPGRCPPGYSLLTSFIGGSQDTAIAGVNSQEIVNIVHSDLIKTTLLTKDAAAPRVLSVRMWPRAIPQYNKGHVELINKVQQACETKAPGLYLGGNYATGVAVGDCIAYGADIANDILTYLAENKH